MDWDEMSNFYGGPSIDASYQISVHLGKWFQRRRFAILVSDWLISKISSVKRNKGSNTGRGAR
jgi:hypothetical protein